MNTRTDAHAHATPSDQSLGTAQEVQPVPKVGASPAGPRSAASPETSPSRRTIGRSDYAGHTSRSRCQGSPAPAARK
eukprot:156042-Alexandrium_andersonii.AAC.1